MSTPVRRTDAPTTPAKAETTTYVPVEPLPPVVAPLGWVIALSGSIALMLCAWLIFPNDHDGMYDGYRSSILATVALMAILALKVDIARIPLLVITGLCGLASLLAGIFDDATTGTMVSEIAGGITLLLGVAMMASSPKDIR
ncbi:hypothetical protein [Nocardioides sp. zg-DK7169]|uniref:hypothetical protein n=1 Tax=Nocardioides sp. zg-DK7169 TaxID=2736600 RepID=UPI00155388FF|nr:hypothetical protein [Nocardioides sp. zg-DK7169]NPC96419.1 hypothetical protein [Nocardioides sp. zg-DK7169]